jgi:hypothetical protein
MRNSWSPLPGDRVRTVLSRDHVNEVVYLNGDHALVSTVSDEFLIVTSEWVPWAHQVIDYLSSRPGADRRTVLRQLMEYELLHREVDFDQLCLMYLEETEEAARRMSKQRIEPDTGER